jgi:resuscitation-promoting factor RpfB
MTIVRRIFLLVIVSIGGIALVAPLAAQSAAPAAPAVEERLLELGEAPAPAAGGATIERGGVLSARSAADTLEPTEDAEAVDAQPMPTPGTAPMEPTLYSTATPPIAAEPAPAPVTYSGSSVWDDLAQCESGGNWAINTGNGYYGGLQFSHATWHGYGGGEFAEYPHQATREEQIIVAERLRATRGYAPWPACRDKLGLP